MLRICKMVDLFALSPADFTKQVSLRFPFHKQARLLFSPLVSTKKCICDFLKQVLLLFSPLFPPLNKLVRSSRCCFHKTSIFAIPHRDFPKTSSLAISVVVFHKQIRSLFPLIFPLYLAQELQNLFFCCFPPARDWRGAPEARSGAKRRNERERNPGKPVCVFRSALKIQNLLKYPLYSRNSA